jgi:hypothetical protein
MVNVGDGVMVWVLVATRVTVGALVGWGGAVVLQEVRMRQTVIR